VLFSVGGGAAYFSYGDVIMGTGNPGPRRRNWVAPLSTTARDFSLYEAQTKSPGELPFLCVLVHQPEG